MDNKKQPTILGKPWKNLPWQITKMIDKFGNKKIQIKYYAGKKGGGWNFNKYQAIYTKIKDWDELKSLIKKSKKRR